MTGFFGSIGNCRPHHDLFQIDDPVHQMDGSTKCQAYKYNQKAIIGQVFTACDARMHQNACRTDARIHNCKTISKMGPETANYILGNLDELVFR